MSDEVETMAYSGEVPWHGLGKRVLPDLTPEQMLVEAGLDWTVEKRRLHFFNKYGTTHVAGDKMALVRSSDGKMLDIVSNSWNPLQNIEAFEFFNDFIMAGEMEMHTAGSLLGGQRVWALAKVGESFEILGGDKVDSYLLFSNPHKFGAAIDVRFTPVRVVCNNTLTMSLGQRAERMVKVNHRSEFDADAVKATLGVATNLLTKYKEAALFLSGKRYTKDTLAEYFNSVFPSMSYNNDAKDKVSRQATICGDVMETQPGANYGRGSWWQALNAITFTIDHKLSRTADARMSSAWYGQNQTRKVKALHKAVDFAEAA